MSIVAKWWYLLFALIVSLLGCSPTEMHNQYKAEAVSAVLSHMNEDQREALTLKGEANPWGLGVIVYNVNAGRLEKVRVWVYYDSEVFALDQDSLAMTRNLSLLDAADQSKRQRIGIETVSGDEVRSTVFRAITQQRPLPEVR